MEEVNLEQLQLLHPTLRPYVKVLLTHEFGLLGSSAKIYGIESGGIIRKDLQQFGDRFQLRIFYCQKPLNWQVLLNGNDITKTPDFIMEENFLATETSDSIGMKVPSLVNWDPCDVNCLLNVVLELLELYKNYQLSLLGASPYLQRYFLEYEVLLTKKNFDPNDIEVHVQLASRTIVVLFLIHLNVNFSNLPIALPDSKNLTVLMIEFKDNSKSTIQFIPRIELEGALGSPLNIPDLPSDVCLYDYVSHVESILQNKVDKIIIFFKHRKLLYSYLVQFFEPALISGDNINFTRVSFLLQLNSFFCILDVHIPMNYPEAQPTLQLLTFKKTTNFLASDFNDFVYERSMPHEEVAQNIFMYLKNVAIDEFQKSTA